MNSKEEIIQALNQILKTKSLQRVEFIKAFQKKIWNDESIQDPVLNEILTSFAYDLDFYEPNEEWKKESPSYYGDERLEELVKIGIQNIEEYYNGNLSN